MNVYKGRQTLEAYRSVKSVGVSLGMSESWSPDPGRLEDAIGGTLLAVTSGTHFSGPLNVSHPCCHGMAGIFGRRFADALTASGKQLMLAVHYTIEGDRLTFGEYRLSLV